MPPPYGGTQNVSLLYAKTWKKMGHNVGVTFVYKPENADDLGAKADYFFEYTSRPNKVKKILNTLKFFLQNPRLYIYLFKKYFSIYPKFSRETFIYTAYGVWISGVIDKFKPDIIACQTALIKTFMVAEIAKLRNIPIVFEPYAEIHDLKMGVNKNLNEEEREKYWKYFLGLSDLVIGMDNCTVGPLMYLPENRVKAFYDTCDFEYYQKELTEKVEDVRKGYNLPKDMFLLTMTGAFHYRKGHDQLIKAISVLNKRGHKNIGAVIVGGNVGKEKWVDLANEEGVSENVFFLQNLNEEQKWKLYKSVDGYCNLSNSTRSCGLDLALLEAMSCAIPVVVYDNGALPTCVPGGKNGYVVPTGSHEAVAEAILQLYKKSKEERRQMAEESRKFASRTDLNVTAKIKEGWFLDIIKNHNK
jgi:glycosyltransferase involved in cell wall biosynthesis